MEDQGPKGETNLVNIYKKEEKKKRQKYKICTAHLDRNTMYNGDFETYSATYHFYSNQACTCEKQYLLSGGLQTLKADRNH